ncbi:MAG TPA: hypothetical protein PLB51_01245 [Candidatus Paceibacterota bacterium]|nr:hypothetical protein [Candidatus Paceibacterota bacterium]
MITQLKAITNQALYNLAGSLLVSQALYLALTGKIQWTRETKDTLQSKVLLGLPGEEPFEIKVLFHRDRSEDIVSFYLQLEDKNGPCLNDADKNIAGLAETLFGKQAQAA